jgi:hypothetical protein
MIALLAGAAALTAHPGAALAELQSMPGMPGMAMPAPKPPPKPKSVSKHKPELRPKVRSAAPVTSDGMPGMEVPQGKSASSAEPAQMPMPPTPQGAEPMTMPMPQPQPQQQMQPAPEQPMQTDMTAHHEMTGALGPYPITREASGTAWQPDSSEDTGLMEMSGGWMLMAHGVANFVYDHQSGPRGDNMAFVSGMVMGMASHRLGNGSVQFRAMLSPEPLMGPRGYPLLLATGETANGRDRLIDRQHPHDLFMELSTSLSQNIGRNSSVFLYGGLPGEPAFGPPAFMHRESIMDSPEAPISHHWLDSTHISFGVLTAGIVVDRVKLEISRFNAREPDQHRWNIETAPLDSTSVRVSWNPTRTLALQGSWGHFTEPEQLEPGVDQKRLSASALYANDVAPDWHLATTLAWGRKTVEHHNDDAVAVEASLKHYGWTIFGRGEMTENRELTLADTGPAYRVGKLSVGALKDFRIAQHIAFGAGGLIALNFVPASIAPLYGGSNPTGMMAFVRLKLQ